MTKEQRKIYKPGPVRGFPEWLPEERIAEQRWFDHIRRVFESYGFCNIETPSVEELDVLTAKGEVDKEIYVIERLHKDADDGKDARLALHFDQTVPMARYVAMRFNDLVFPFKRYQMQRVWRGERPQMGRMREFYQCDIDVINVDNLPLSFDAEVASMMYEVMEGLDIGKVQLRINNRKILTGLLKCFGIEDATPIIRIIDKSEKQSKSDTMIALGLELDRLQKEQSLKDVILELVSIKKPAKEFSGLLRDFITRNDVIARSVSDEAIQTMQEGIAELEFVLNNLSHLPEHVVMGDLTIVRGLDYYTGTVYETQLLDVPEFTGSVCSGGRYDDLAGSYINKHLPGVGISLGFSRLFDVIRQTRPELLKIGPKGPAHILMTVPENEADRPAAYDAARTLRKRDFNVEMYHAPKKIGDQLKYASKKNLPFVWFVRDGAHEVKDMVGGSQVKTTPEEWGEKR